MTTNGIRRCHQPVSMSNSSGSNYGALGMEQRQQQVQQEVDVEAGARAMADMGCGTSEYIGHPYALGRTETLQMYGTYGIGSGTLSMHNKAYALGFNVIQYVVWYICLPLSVPFAFTAGLFVRLMYIYICMFMRTHAHIICHIYKHLHTYFSLYLPHLQRLRRIVPDGGDPPDLALFRQHFRPAGPRAQREKGLLREEDGLL